MVLDPSGRDRVSGVELNVSCNQAKIGEIAMKLYWPVNGDVRVQTDVIPENPPLTNQRRYDRASL
jgi:vacuolar-type H+-ATPase catalytic subunit A/Vma1